MRLRSSFLALLPLIASSSTAFSQSNTSFEINQNSAKTGLTSGLNGFDGAVQGDFNNDGKPDVITADSLGSNLQTFNLRLGNGDGTFQPPVQIASIATTTYGQFTNLLAVDLNGDGKLDIVASGYGTPEIDVLLTSGNTFQQPIKLPIPSQAYAAAVTGDFNGDKLVDIAVGDGKGNVKIFQNTGNGSFTPARTIPVGSGDFIYTLAAGDVDNDGKTDLALTDGGNNVRILWGLGNNDFLPVLLEKFPLVYSVSSSATIGDVNQDGSSDVLVTYDCDPTVPGFGSKGLTARCGGIDLYYGGQGKQTTYFRRAVNDRIVTTLFNLMPVDVNGDGIADLVAQGAMGNTLKGVSVWLGNPDGSFKQTAQTFPATAEYGGELISGDFNRDGMTDFLLTGTPAVYLNATTNTGCAASRINPTVIACQPVDNTYTAGPSIPVQAAAYDTTRVTALQEYIDGKLLYSQPETTLDMQFPEGLGPHLLVTKAWDANGVSFRTARHVTVYDGTPGAVCSSYGPGSADLCLPLLPNVYSPVRILANGSTSAIPTAAQIYIDGNLKVNDTSHSTSVDTTQTLSPGTHEVVFKLFDANGHSYIAERTLSVQ